MQRHTVYVVARIPRYINAETWVEAAQRAIRRVYDGCDRLGLAPDFVDAIKSDRVEEWEDSNYPPTGDLAGRGFYAEIEY